MNEEAHSGAGVSIRRCLERIQLSRVHHLFERMFEKRTSVVDLNERTGGIGLFGLFVFFFIFLV